MASVLPSLGFADQHPVRPDPPAPAPVSSPTDRAGSIRRDPIPKERNMRLTVTLTILACGWLHAADAPQPDPAAMPEAMQEAMQEMSTTGAEHENLARMIGTWDVASTMWMPGAEPQRSSGKATITAVLGGKWFQQDYAGEMMNQPYHGIGLYGYDTWQDHYVATWYDDFSTGLTKMTGSSEDGGKTITYTSEMPHCPMTGGPISFRHVQVQDADDRIVYTMYQTPEGGEEFKSMELVYTRAE